jgi:hypothetical protein
MTMLPFIGAPESRRRPCCKSSHIEPLEARNRGQEPLNRGGRCKEGFALSICLARHRLAEAAEGRKSSVARARDGYLLNPVDPVPKIPLSPIPLIPSKNRRRLAGEISAKWSFARNRKPSHVQPRGTRREAGGRVGTVDASGVDLRVRHPYCPAGAPTAADVAVAALGGAGASGFAGTGTAPPSAEAVSSPALALAEAVGASLPFLPGSG